MALALLVLVYGRPLRAADDLVATVTWTDSASATGTMLFQGTAEGTVLQGSAYTGDSQLVVNGTIQSDGTTSGTLTTAEGLSVGTVTQAPES
jgi:hypothetical protein